MDRKVKAGENDVGYVERDCSRMSARHPKMTRQLFPKVFKSNCSPVS